MEIVNKILKHVEMNLAVNWFNPFATLYLNLRLLPIQQAIKFPVWCYGRPRFYNLSGQMEIDSKISSGMIRFNKVRYGAPSCSSVQSELAVSGTIIFRGKTYIGTGTKIVVNHNAVLEIGDGCEITDMVNVGCMDRIFIGDGVSVTHRCQIMDSNYHYVVDFNNSIIPRCSNHIFIGNHCWICNSSTIMGGSRLPEGTIVASNSLVNKDFSAIEPNSIIAGIPARFIASGYRRVFNMQTESAITEFVIKNPGIPYKYTPDILI